MMQMLMSGNGVSLQMKTWRRVKVMAATGDI